MATRKKPRPSPVDSCAGAAGASGAAAGSGAVAVFPWPWRHHQKRSFNYHIWWDFAMDLTTKYLDSKSPTTFQCIDFRKLKLETGNYMSCTPKYRGFFLKVPFNQFSEPRCSFREGHSAGHGEEAHQWFIKSKSHWVLNQTWRYR